MLDWLKTVNGHGVKLSVRDGQSAGLWEPGSYGDELEGMEYRTVIMPMRM